MFFTKKERGYTPWAPRKAPVFNTSLNATYIKLSAALTLSLILFVGGFVSSPMIMSLLQLDTGFFTVKTKSAHLAPIAKLKPIVKAPQPVITPIPAPVNVQTSTELTVPAIPMATEAVKTSTKITAEEILKRDYGVSTYDALLFINSAKDASLKTGIDPSLLLAVAAKISKFQLLNGKKFIGVMNIKPELHQKEVQKLKLENISYATIDGSFRLGAEVLLSYFNQSNGDMSAALNKFITANKVLEQPTLAEVLDLKKQFEGM